MDKKESEQELLIKSKKWNFKEGVMTKVYNLTKMLVMLLEVQIKPRQYSCL